MPSLSAMSDAGKPVDWWFMYKVSRRDLDPKGPKVDGTQYVYYEPGAGALAQSAHTVDKASGALHATLDQIYGAGAGAKNLGWLFYNDEVPGGATTTSRGHTKGALAFDLDSDSAFWLIVSTPKFPAQKSYAYPPGGEIMAQTLLCISLENASTARAIADQMLVAHQPMVYAASDVPAKLVAVPTDPRVQLLHNNVDAHTTATHTVVPFRSRAKKRFSSIAKNRHWSFDFYNDLLSPTLHEGIEVETWEHGATPKPAAGKHHVVAAVEVDLNPLAIPVAWANANDHAKLAITDRDQHPDAAKSPRYVCVGDINFTKTMEKRGGGTVAFEEPKLWKALDDILLTRVPPHHAP
jgi:deoxyribonuclease-2